MELAKRIEAGLFAEERIADVENPVLPEDLEDFEDGTTCLSSNNVMRPAGQAARGFLSQNPAPVQKSGLRPGPLWDMDLRKRRFS